MRVPRLEWRVLLVVLAATLAGVTALWTAIPPMYLTNDDVTIRRDLEGLAAPNAQPTGFVLMAHSLLGWTLVGVQRVLPIHAWDVVLGALFIGSVSVILSLAWSSAADRLVRVAVVLALMVTLAPLLGGVQFTISATVAGGAAFALAATELFSARPRGSVLVVAACLVFAGLLVRPMGATAGTLVTGGLLVPLTLADASARRARMARVGLLFVVTGVTALALVYLDDLLYRTDAAWHAYQQNNWMTARLFEWGGDVPAQAIEQMRTRAGWSANDWATLKGMWGVDPDVHGFARVTTAYESWTGVIDWRVRAQSVVDRVRVIDLGTFKRLITESALALTAALVIAAVQAGRRGAVAVGSVLVIFFAACLVIEVVFKELPFRLFAPLQACLIVAIALTAGTLRRAPSRPVTAVGLLVVAAVAAWQGRVVALEAIADDQQAAAIERQVMEVLQLQPSLLVLHADSFPSEFWWRPFHTPDVRIAAIQMGLNNRKPSIDRYLADTHRAALLRAICADPSILVVSEPGRLEPVTAFVREHYGMEVSWTEVYAGSFRVWRCTPR